MAKPKEAKQLRRRAVTIALNDELYSDLKNEAGDQKRSMAKQLEQILEERYISGQKK